MRPLPSNNEISSILTDELDKDAYHRGFLLHASRIKAFLGDRVPSFIIGHSLGAASAQILGTHFNVPTICLASPQVVKRRYLKQDALRSKTHAQWNVFNIAWRKDFVTKGYRMAGLRCLGHRVVVDSKRINFGIDHFVKDYEKLIVSAIDDNAKLPESWPDLEYGLPSRLA
jgi:hypothetical protein